MSESVSKVSVIGKGSRRARMRASGLFRVPVTLAGIVIAMVVGVMGMGVASAAAAATPGAGWELTARTYPSNLAPGSTGMLEINVHNVGGGPPGGIVTVTDTLPSGLTALEAGEPTEQGIVNSFWHCNGSTLVRCTLDAASGLPVAHGGAGGGGQMELAIRVKVDPGAAGTVVNRVTVAGGGAPTPATASNSITLSSSPGGFRFTGWDAWVSNADGTLDNQAGSHPYEATFSFDLATSVNEGSIQSIDELRNIEVNLPPGLVGDPNAVPQCTRQQLELFNVETGEGCPLASQVGIATIHFASFAQIRLLVYNMVPPPGVAAEFAFNFSGIVTTLDSTPRTGADYGITTHVVNAPQRGIESAVVTLWGYPADPSHDVWRNGDFAGCIESKGCVPSHVAGGARKPLLTLPTSCDGPRAFSIHANTWRDPSLTSEASFLWHDGSGIPTGLTGCDHLGFGPWISVAPDTSFADTPAGLTVDVKVPQDGLLSTEGLSTSNIKNTTVTLPNGVVINPGQAAGLAACQSSEDGVGTEGPPSCPNASKVGTDEIETPLLAHPLKGSVYVLQSNPPNLKLLVAASGEGVNLKLVGNVHLDESTGQLTTTFTETPELPFTDFKLSFSGGAQAALDTPTACGTYETTSDFTPWSTPSVADVFPASSFAIEHGPGGAPCPSSPLPFSPSMIAGATTDQAGGFTSFSLLLQRGDGQQRIEKLQFRAPAGLSGMISSVALCQEPQAAAGTCPAASHIGHAVVTSGPGPYPLVLPQPGEPELPIYLTGPYKGAPFGLSIVTPVIAGPFNLGTIVTRAKIEIDPHTAQITITTDPLPQIVKGVPTDLRSINSVIDRSGFMFNPTNCNPQEFTGTATSVGGAATAPLSSHFQVRSCRSLEFHPKFSVSTSAHSTRANGQSLTAKLSYPNAPQGTQSEITKVKVDLPIQLPSRLTTLQKACLDKVFEANPANCPPQSIVGQARVITPQLPVPLTGPAYFVSHGGEEFPALTMVLQGDGVTVDLVGSTFINKKGITSTTFKTVPDVPFNTFELTLPKGRFSALGSNLSKKAKGSFCGQNLKMPTLFVAQNGLEIHQQTPITVTGCPKHKKARKARKSNHHSRPARHTRRG
jgi:uncharacterized repeat protein (TIGR01451 family)